MASNVAIAEVERHSSASLSIIFAVRNSWSFLADALDSVQNCGVAAEILVVDNGSADGTADRLHSWPNVRVIRNDRNQGHCRAINQGIRAATGEFLLVLDADTVLWPNSVKVLLDFMQAHPEAAVAAPRMLNDDGSVQETARSFPTILNGLFGRQSLLTRLFPRNRFALAYLRREKVSAIEPFQVDWVSAAAMIFRRSLTEKIGLWDEQIPGYWVDADWCKMAQAVGDVYCVPSAKVTHFEQNRWGKKKGAQRIILFHKGAHRFYRKHVATSAADPRGWFCGAALTARMIFLLAIDAWRAEESDPARPDRKVLIGETKSHPSQNAPAGEL